ncbi:hypothetical protein X777_10771 [Ooceraea biroi]|uniref:Uncharacterized protein n=1 Tax=Ooceraea biroi TaxID=2015173 RepID=A0A026W524_OOCBI|nr:hypothetical protein X777_10771 [Ooceraea biroi]
MKYHRHVRNAQLLSGKVANVLSRRNPEEKTTYVVSYVASWNKQPATRRTTNQALHHVAIPDNG